MKRYLIDTHALLWACGEPKKLTNKIKRILESEAEIFFSYASIWEMALKIENKKLKLPLSLPEFIEHAREKIGITLLPLELEVVYNLDQIPLHHRDPFDRLLISQAIHHQLLIVSCDDYFDEYHVKRVWN